MSQNELTFRIKATDEATPTIKKVEKAQEDLTKSTKEQTKAQDKASQSDKKRASSLKDVDSGMGRLNATLDKAKTALGVAGAAFGVYTAIANKANQEWAEQNKLNQNLQRALINTGSSAESAAKQVDALNMRLDRMSRLTRFDDEVLSAGLEKLTQVTKSSAIGLRDLELAMDLSTRTGKDLNGMVDALTKAYNGEYMELVPLGLITKAQAEEFQRMTDKGMATQKVLEILRKETAGLATNLTEAEKATRGLNADMDALWESLGKGIDNVLGPLNVAFGKLAGGESGEKGFIGIFAEKLDKATTSWGKFIENFGDAKVENFLKVSAALGFIVSTGGMAAIPMIAGSIMMQDVDSTMGPTATGYVPGAGMTAPDIDWDPNITYEKKKARDQARRAKKGKVSGPTEDPNQALLKGIEEDLRKREELERQLNALSMERFNREAQARQDRIQTQRYELEHQKALEQRAKERQESQRKHQEWLMAKQKEMNDMIASNVQQSAGLVQQGASMAGAPNGVGSIVGGVGSMVGGYFTMNPMAMIGGGLSIIDGISSLAGGSKEEKNRERDQRRREREKMVQDAKKERIEFQKSLQNAIVDALRESRENLAITYIINQSGTYLGGDPASLREVRQTLESGRIERRR